MPGRRERRKRRGRPGPPAADGPPIICLLTLGCAKNEVDSERLLGLLAESGLAVSFDPSDSDVILVNTCGFISEARAETAEFLGRLRRLREEGRIRAKAILAIGCMARRAAIHPELAPAVSGADMTVSFEDYGRLPEIVRAAAKGKAPAAVRPAAPASPWAEERAGPGRRMGAAGAPAAGSHPGTPAAGTETDRPGGGKSGGGWARPGDPAGRMQPEPGSAAPPCADPFEDAPRLRPGRRPHAFLKISEGCDNRCAYCAIGIIRGPHRSAAIGKLLAEARGLAETGCRELCVVAQDTTRYGLDLYGSPRLPDLLRELARIDGIRWIRLLYAHPARLDETVLRTLASDGKFCPYIDVPLQHADDDVLRAMGRGISRRDIDALLDRIRRLLPGAAIRTTFLVGHPGETEAAFRRLLEFVREGHFAHMGAFAYSPEPGTPSASMEPPCDAAEAACRRDELMRAQRGVSARWCASFVGEEFDALVDAPAGASSMEGPPPPDARWQARINRQAPDTDGVTWLAGDGGIRSLAPGDIVRVRITGAGDYDLEARPLGTSRPKF
ncbi:MAG: 30S ribosomal protein S12 methylthiotransferase RimO [Planctomycetota bacterium]|nr:30S ribosomal protein S12 methylthiotransferase RimO [Planctomycetota bacterium]